MLLWNRYPGPGTAHRLQHSLEEIREIAGADSLGYLPLEDLHQLAPKAACGFCDGCFTERYPVDLE